MPTQKEKKLKEKKNIFLISLEEIQLFSKNNWLSFLSIFLYSRLKLWNGVFIFSNAKRKISVFYGNFRSNFQQKLKLIC